MTKLNRFLPDQEIVNHRVAVRRFIAESCELARKLPPKKKCLFLMHFESGFSNREIAELCKVDEGTVSRRLKKVVEEINEMRNCCNGDNDGSRTVKVTK